MYPTKIYYLDDCTRKQECSQVCDQKKKCKCQLGFQLKLSKCIGEYYLKGNNFNNIVDYLIEN